MVGEKKHSSASIIKFCGLIAFFIVVGLIVWYLWPTIHELFEDGGTERVVQSVRDAGAAGVFILLALQLLQVIVAFIPGEVVQIAAGAIYGWWLGAIIIIVGACISSAIIFLIVRKLGAPFVQEMVPIKYLSKFKDFEKTGKLDAIVFVLFLIPGLPKDVFTYIVPLTDMEMKNFLVLTTIGRIPAIVLSTIAASSLIEGDVMTSGILFGVAAAIAIIGAIFSEKIINLLNRGKQK